MSGWVHRAAAAGFAASAPEYERGRPGYPPEAVELVVAELGLGRGSRVLDLAAGTGKLSRPLAAAGLEVLAVEPVAEMRALIGPPIEAVEGTAEELPTQDASVDAVTVAQAFHWFDGERALVEIHRVLRPGGGLALVWNRRADDDEVTAAVEEIIGPHRGETPHHRSGRWRDAFEATDLFGPLSEHRFANSQELDAELLAMRFGSVSFVASLAEDERRSVEERLRALAADGPVELNYVTEVFCTRTQSGR
jgi:SAM-dependent methyltransferase